MLHEEWDVVIVGGGPAGLAAAIAARRGGAQRVLILERDRELGGILFQCIHPGFGLHVFREELTGPEYAQRFIERLWLSGVEVRLNTMVLEIDEKRHIYAVSPEHGGMELAAGALVLAMGCRERTRGALGIPGTRPSGIFTAGAAQRFVNVEGYMPGREVVILGSGDVGLIMARRLCLEGASVAGVVEIRPYPGGLLRNVIQCLRDFDIPLFLGHTIVSIEGRKRLSGVRIARVDGSGHPVPKSERYLPCDTLLLSVGLIPENELSRALGVEIDSMTGGPVTTDNMETSIRGVFACGNVVDVKDLVDDVTAEGEMAGESAAAFVLGKPMPDFSKRKARLRREAARRREEKERLYAEGEAEDAERVVCTICPVGCLIRVRKSPTGAWHMEGARCQRGRDYAEGEVTNLKRVVTTTVGVVGGRLPVVPVRTSRPIPKDRIFDCIEALRVLVDAPIRVGQVILENVAGSGADIVATRSLERA